MAQDFQEAAACKSHLPQYDLSMKLRSCRHEIINPVLGSVSFGNIPAWLRGCLVMNGPGGIEVFGDDDATPQSYRHLFDCPGLLHKFHFKDSNVFYTNRFVKTSSYKNNLRAKRFVLSEFGTAASPDPCQTIFHRLSALFTGNLEDLITDTANISIHPFGDEVYALAESGYAHRIELPNLNTKQKVNVNKDLGIIHHTSHPHVFEKLHKVYNVGQNLGAWMRPHYVIFEMDTTPRQTENHGLSPWSTAKIVAEIPSRWLLHVGYMHSFAMTQNFFILIEQPLCTYWPRIPVGLIFNTDLVTSALRSYPKEETLLHVVPRHGEGARRSFRASTFFFFHTINAFENAEGNIVVDICCYKDPSLIEATYIEALKNGHKNPDCAKMLRSRPKRFLMNTSLKDLMEGPAIAEEEQIVDISCEAPTINPGFNTRRYKCFYATSSDIDYRYGGWLIKVNVEEKSFRKWGEPGCNSYGSEPIFVQNPGTSGEDDGIVLSSLLYGGEDIQGPNKVSVVILDARKWEPLAKVDFHPGGSVPQCLHGWFFPSPELGEQSKQDGQDAAN